MSHTIEQKSPPDYNLDIRIGCAIAAFIPFSCMLSLIPQFFYAMVVFGPSNMYVPEEVKNTPLYGFLYGVGYTMAGALPFALLVTLLHASLLFRAVPSSTRKRWLLLTSAGAVGSWLVFWTLFSVVLGGNFEFFSQLFRQSEDSLASTLWAMLLVSLAGTLLAATSAFPVAGIAWLALRRYLPGSHWRIFLVVLLSSLVTGFVLSFYMWGTRWGWN